MASNSNDSKTPGNFADKVVRRTKQTAAGIALVASSAGLAPSNANAGPLDGVLNEVLKKVPGANEIINGAQGRPVYPAPAPAPQSVPLGKQSVPLGANQQQPVQTVYQKPDDLNFGSYSYKAPLSTSYGKADLTTAVDAINDGDQRFTAASKAMLDDVMHSIPALKKGFIPSGITKLRSSSISQDEKAQVLGSVVLMLRSGAAINANDRYKPGTDIRSETRNDIETRTTEGGKIIALLARAVPEIKDIEYSWMQPTDANARRTSNATYIPAPGNKRTGNLGQFLASGVEDRFPTGDGYRLHDEAWSPSSQKIVDDALVNNQSASLSR